MHTHYRSRTVVGLCTGIAFRALGTWLLTLGPATTIGLLLEVVGALLLVWACAACAAGKGYPRALGLLGLVSCPGVALVLLLPARAGAPTGPPEA